MANLTLRLSDENLDSMRWLANEHRRSLNSEVLVALEHWIEHHEITKSIPEGPARPE